MHYHFKIHRDPSDKTYWAECIELDGCMTHGSSLEELKKYMHEALNLYLSEPHSSLLVFPAPKLIYGKDIIPVEVDSSVFFAMSLRQARLKRKLTQKEMMSHLGIKTLSNYQRLENPNKANPELRTLVALKRALPELNLSFFFDQNISRKKKVG